MAAGSLPACLVMTKLKNVHNRHNRLHFSNFTFIANAMQNGVYAAENVLSIRLSVCYSLHMCRNGVKVTK